MRIWWYLSSQFIKSILGALFFALTLYFVLTYMEESQYYFDTRKVSSNTLFLYYFWQIPSIFVTLLPFAVLIGGIICNWILARHGEISALRAAGMSMMRIFIPFLSIGMVFSILQFVVNEMVIPYTFNQFQYIKTVKVEKGGSDDLFTTSPWLKTDHSILHFQKYQEESQTLDRPELFTFQQDKTAINAIIHAKSAYFDSNSRRWVLKSVVFNSFDAAGKEIFIKETPFYITDIAFAPPQVLKQKSDSSQLSYWRLKQLIKQAQIAGTNVSDRIVDLQFKLSLPFANFFFVFLTLPFALRKERQEETYIGIVVCVIVALVYWFGNLSLRNLANAGEMNPFLAAWLMNALVILISSIFVLKLDKGQ